MLGEQVGQGHHDLHAVGPSRSCFSLETLSGTVQMTRYPRTAPIRARPTPVFPRGRLDDRASWPQETLLSASSIIATAIRS